MDNQSKVIEWKPEDDAYCVWAFIMGPIGGINEFSSPRDDIPVDSLQDRFFEIMKSGELQRKVNKYMKGDIVHFHRVKFSLLEKYQMFNAARLLKTTNPTKILKVFQPYFHLTRTPNSIVAQQFKEKLFTYANFLAHFLKFKKNALLSSTPEERDEIDLNLHSKDLSPYTIPNIAQRLIPLNFFQSFGDIIDHIQPLFSKSDFCALRGPGTPILINRAVVTIGRKSFFNDEIDIDLSHYGNSKKISRHHATLMLASDMHFYMTIFGQNAIVNGGLIQKGKVVRLSNGSIVDLGGYLFVFVENRGLMSQLREGLVSHQ